MIKNKAAFTISVKSICNIQDKTIKNKTSNGLAVSIKMFPRHLAVLQCNEIKRTYVTLDGTELHKCDS